MKKLRVCLALAAVAALLLGCSGPSDRKVIIVSTNDTHAAIEVFPQLTTLIDSLRRTGAPVVLVDAGDWTTGNPYADLFPRRGAPQIELMNALGYDLATLGNHEFDNGIDTLALRLSEARFGVISANMHTNGSMPGLPPYKIIDAGPLRLGFLGLITVAEGGHPEGFRSSFGRATFDDPIGTAKKYACIKDSCDILIALSHLGFEKDSMLATAVPQIEMIIGGHSHTILPEGRWIGGGLAAGGTFITQTGSKLRYAGVTTLTVGKEGHITNVEFCLVDLSKLVPNPEIAQMVAYYKNNPRFTQVVGEAADYFGKNALMSLYADALRAGTGADVAVTNRGGVRIDYLNPGPVTRGDIFMLEPFGNKAVVVPMSEARIREMILEKFNSEGKEGHSIELWPSGMRYSVTTDARGEGKDVKLHIAAAGHGSVYRVAMSDYVQSALLSTDSSADNGAAIAPITSLIEKYLAARTPLRPDTVARAFVRRPAER